MATAVVLKQLIKIATASSKLDTIPFLFLSLQSFCCSSAAESHIRKCFRIRCRGYCSCNDMPTASQISYYVRLGEIEMTRKLFDRTPQKSIASWNSIISGYFQYCQPNEAQCLFDAMPEKNTVSWNGLISGYIKNRVVKKAREVFDLMPKRERNVITWAAMVRGYVEEGLVSEAEALFWRMPMKNVISWTVVLNGLIREGRIDDAKIIYDLMPVKDVVAKTTMIGGLCSKGQLDEAQEIFDCMMQKNIVSWTTMISGYVQNGKADIARKLFEGAWELFKAMPIRSVVACNAMIIGLGENGEVSRARKVFDLMRENDNATWEAMIKIYERKGFELEALCLLPLMQSGGVKSHFPSLISILSVCATLDHGKQIHAQVVRSKFADDVYLSSTLMTMYMKCGDVVKAKVVFDRSSCKDIVMWNSLITGYAQRGLGDEALQVFREMYSSGIQADDIKFIGILSGCSYSGKAKEGKEIFESMKSKYKIEPTTAHYACMVDMLGRAGQLNEAYDLINEMTVEADAIVWGSLMGTCRNHMNSALAEVAAKKLVQLEPKNAGPFVLLSNIYASKGRWGDVATLRKKMKCRKVSKSPGCSWIEVDREVHMFTGGQSTPHPEHMLIIRTWEKLSGMLREAGYSPDGAFSLHDVEEEEKAQNLTHHSEKLAVVFGLLKLPEGITGLLPFSYHRKVKIPKSSVNPEHLVMLMMLLTSSAEYGAVASQAQRISSSDCWL
ncbi:hypothetical protein SASPL_143196 [Salvia splendens]|uniref:DYW domain-containing protein n=1 Tax=Salvia splendens TaxID=180675 RepID=A0A8X8WKF3_SALSN|nr:hypothetical protein SASPL_143196 [Salvia splendens]